MNLATAHPVENESGDADSNDVIIRSYTAIGKVNGIGLGFVEVEAREAVIPDRRHTAYFVRVSADTGGDYPQNSVAVIQYDHLPKLLGAMERLQTATINTNRFQFSEVEFEIDGLKLIVFNDARGKLMFAVSIGAISVHFSSTMQLGDLRTLIGRAKQHLDTNKIEF